MPTKTPNKTRSGREKKPRGEGKPFEPGNPGGGAIVGEKMKLPAGTNIAEALQLAFTTGLTPGEQPAVTVFRKMLHRNPDRFMAIYTRVGDKVAASAPSQEVSQTPAVSLEPPDDGTVRVQERVVALLGEMGWSPERIEELRTRSASRTRGDGS
jgi:hypothetical protein